MSDWWSADPVASGQPAGPQAPALAPAHRDLAIRTIYGEAGNEPDQGQAAVAAVIRNRMQAGRYGGDTIPGVVLAKNQFEPWGNADARSRMMALKPDDPRYQKLGSIVDQVFSGQMEDPTGGATHFVAPAAQAALGRGMPAWAQGEGLPIGRHTFFAPEGRVQSAGAQGGNWWSNDPVATQEAPPSQPAPVGANTEGLSNRVAREGMSLPVATAGEAAKNAFLNSASFNFRDELNGLAAAGGLDPQDPNPANAIAALVKGGYRRLTGDPQADAEYRVRASQDRAESQRMHEQQPGASLAGDLGGGLSTLPIGGFAAKGPGLGARVAQGARTGALYGAVSGAGEGTDAGSRLTSATTGGAVGAAIGAAIPVGLAAAAAPFTSKAAAPTIGELKAAASASYNSPEVKGLVVQGQAVKDLSASIQTELNKIGIDENLAPKTFGILAKLDNAPPGAMATGDNINSMRRIFGNAASSVDATERKAAKQAIDAIDNFVPNLAPKDVISGDAAGAAAKWAEARANFAAAARSESIDKKTIQAELRAAASNSGQNVANTVRQRMADILLKPAELRGYTMAERAQMEKIVRGTTTGNALRFTGNLLGGGGGLGAITTAAVGGLATGGPGAVAPVVGFALKQLSNRMTLKQAEVLSEAVRSRAPLAKSMAAFGQKAAALQQLQSPATVSGAMLAARNLSNNLRDAGINMTPADIFKALTGPVKGAADEDQKQ